MPAGLNINASTGAITGAPSKSSAAGSFVVVVTDKSGSKAELTINYGKIGIDKVGVPVVTGGNNPDTGKPCFTWAPVDGAAKYEVHRYGMKNGEYKLFSTTTNTSFSSACDSRRRNCPVEAKKEQAEARNKVRNSGNRLRRGQPHSLDRVRLGAFSCICRRGVQRRRGLPDRKARRGMISKKSEVLHLMMQKLAFLKGY